MPTAALPYPLFPECFLRVPSLLYTPLTKAGLVKSCAAIREHRCKIHYKNQASKCPFKIGLKHARLSLPSEFLLNSIRIQTKQDLHSLSELQDYKWKVITAIIYGSKQACKCIGVLYEAFFVFPFRLFLVMKKLLLADGIKDEVL